MKIRSKEAEITTDFTEIKIIRGYSVQLHVNKLHNRDEMDTFLKKT